MPDPSDATPRSGAIDLVGVDGSPTGGGRTASAVRQILAAAGGLGAATEVVSLAKVGMDRAVDRIEAAEGLVIGSPAMSASFAFPLKHLFDRLSDTWGRRPTPLQGKAVVIVLTSVNDQHFLGLDDLRSVLGGFFAAHVLPPGLHVPAEGFARDGRLDEEFGERADEQGSALVEMVSALRRYPTLRALAPQTFVRDPATDG